MYHTGRRTSPNQHLVDLFVKGFVPISILSPLIMHLDFFGALLRQIAYMIVLFLCISSNLRLSTRKNNNQELILKNFFKKEAQIMGILSGVSHTNYNVS